MREPGCGEWTKTGDPRKATGAAEASRRLGWCEAGDRAVRRTAGGSSLFPRGRGGALPSASAASRACPALGERGHFISDA